MSTGNVFPRHLVVSGFATEARCGETRPTHTTRLPREVQCPRCIARFTPTEARHALDGELIKAFDTLAAAQRATPAPAATLADDVAALRTKVVDFGGVIQDWRKALDAPGLLAARDDMLATLDRIADAVPRLAPTLADDVAALREEIAAWATGEATADHMLALLDRIAGAAPQRATDLVPGDEELRALGEDRTVTFLEDLNAAIERIWPGAGWTPVAAPQRATDTMGVPLWIHTCGTVTSGTDARANYCRKCGVPNAWQPLYTLPGDAS